jgi:acyl carrier protein
MEGNFLGNIYRNLVTMINTTEKTSVDTTVKRLMSDWLGISESELTDSASFADDLGADSLDVYELFMRLEKEFRLQIPEEDAEKLRTVGSVITYLKKQSRH